MEVANGLGILIAILIACFLLWLVFRRLSCWYFKINERVKLQREMNENLKEIIDCLDTLIFSSKPEEKED
ncbi:MAG: hypothetical protein ACTSQE_16935 [Candidatus Heimdallarchaeaceae archaeon]